MLQHLAYFFKSGRECVLLRFIVLAFFENHVAQIVALMVELDVHRAKHFVGGLPIDLDLLNNSSDDLFHKISLGLVQRLALFVHFRNVRA